MVNAAPVIAVIMCRNAPLTLVAGTITSFPIVKALYSLCFLFSLLEISSGEQDIKGESVFILSLNIPVKRFPSSYSSKDKKVGISREIGSLLKDIKV